MDIGELKGEDAEKVKGKIKDIAGLEGIDEETANKLAQANLTQVEQLQGLSVKDLMSIEGITEEEAGLLADAVKKAV